MVDFLDREEARAVVRSFIGLKSFSGWRFTLTPETNEAGSPGFTRETLTPRDGWEDEARRVLHDNRFPSSDHHGTLAKLRAALAAGRPPTQWVEEKWLTQCLRGGLIKEVSDA